MYTESDIERLKREELEEYAELAAREREEVAATSKVCNPEQIAAELAGYTTDDLKRELQRRGERP